MPATPEGAGAELLRLTSHEPAGEKPRFLKEVRDLAARQGWGLAVSNEVELILEEWLTNVISYGLATVPRPTLSLELAVSGDEAVLKVADNGIPFNPLDHPDPDVTKPVDERPIGGLGIFMMKKLAVKLAYERQGGLNVLTIHKDIRHPRLGLPPFPPD